ncbi:hypothetical protein U5640_30680 [Streptomyces sp. SS7]|uniref:hypothetical protein n=1 Tax=Streptomyces sp. SS7 TaxID=3108485 RepID=UPI0030ED24BF
MPTRVTVDPSVRHQRRPPAANWRGSLKHLEEDTAKVVRAGNATFLRLPLVIEVPESAAESGKARIRLDHACRSQL